MSEVTERANRLMGIRVHPGWPDVLRLSQELVNSLTASAIDYPGWDLQQLMVLKARAQAAKEHHELLFAKINEAIQDGIQEQAASTTLKEKTPQEIMEQGDYVRQQVLTRFSEFDSEMRAGGSY